METPASLLRVPALASSPVAIVMYPDQKQIGGGMDGLFLLMVPGYSHYNGDVTAVEVRGSWRGLLSFVLLFGSENFYFFLVLFF